MNEPTDHTNKVLIPWAAQYITHILWYPKFIVGWDSVAGIPTGYGLNGPGIGSQWAARFSAPVKTGPGAHQPPAQWVLGFFPGGKAAKAWR
jgi:hypothetical protein